MISESTIEELVAEHHIEEKFLLLIYLFARPHRELTAIDAITQFLRGEGPAAVAAGRAGYWVPTLRKPRERHIV